MDDLTQCSIIRDDLQKWLAADSTPLEIQQGEKPLTTLLKLFRQPFLVDYLYRTDGGEVSWRDSLAFCGVYSLESGTLYLTKDTASLLAGCPAPFVEESVPSMKEEIAGRINRQVEAVIANDRKNLPVRKLTSWSAERSLRTYLDYDAKEEALRLFINGGELDGLFYSDFHPEINSYCLRGVVLCVANKRRWGVCADSSKPAEALRWNRTMSL